MKAGASGEGLKALQLKFANVHEAYGDVLQTSLIVTGEATALPAEGGLLYHIRPPRADVMNQPNR